MACYPYIYFWSASSLQTAMKKAQKIINTCCTTECMMQTIEDNLNRAPSIRTHITMENWHMAVQADSTWLYKLFDVRFAYWKKYKLLGMVGNLSKNKLKTTGAVCIKNSCGVNYDLKTWKTKIPFFKDRIKQFSLLLAMPPKDVFETIIQKEFMAEEVVQDIIDEKGCDFNNAEYCISLALQQDVFKTLQLNDWLQGKENDAFQHFSLHGIRTTAQQCRLERHLEQLVVTQVGDYDKKKTMYVPLILSAQNNPSAQTILFRHEYDYYDGEPINCNKAKAIIQGIVEQYLETDQGKKFTESHNNPDWLDVIHAVPAMEFTKAGLKPLSTDDYCDTVIFNTRFDRESWEPCDFCEKELDKYPYIVTHSDYDESNACYVPAFCPICGRPLTEDAWQMLEKRIEN